MDKNSAAPAADVRNIAISKIQPSPYQARRQFDKEALKSLADSMHETGLLQPILVRNTDGGYELISGERRLRAARLLGWREIEAKVIQTDTEAEAAAKGLAENLQRRDLNPIEEAEGFKLLNQLDRKEWGQPRIAKVSGRTQGYISQSLRLLDLPDAVKESISRLILSRSHGLEILRLPTKELRLKVARQVPGRLTREETRALVDKMLAKTPASAAKRPGLASVEWEASKGFHFEAHGQWVDVRGSWDRGEDIDTFIAELRAALLVWSSQNASSMESLDSVPRPALPREVRGTAPLKPSAPAVAANSPFLKSHPDLAALAQQSPRAIYSKLFGPADPVTLAVGDQTWEQMGTTWDEGLKVLLEERVEPSVSASVSDARPRNPDQATQASGPPLSPDIAAMIARRKAQRRLP